MSAALSAAELLAAWRTTGREVQQLPGDVSRATASRQLAPSTQSAPLLDGWDQIGGEIGLVQRRDIQFNGSNYHLTTEIAA
jgi:hypothetical protein